jgi:hypothetical protein
MEHVCRNFALVLVIAALCCSIGTTLASAKAKPRQKPATDGDYVSALAAADRFLQAWQMEDQEAGLLMLTDAAKQHASQAQIERFFSPELQRKRGFQITRGKKLREGRYLFPVVLITADSDTRSARLSSSRIIVVRTGHEEWAIDRLP